MVFEISLWLVLFILSFLILRCILKAFCSQRAVFRSAKDNERKKRDVDEEGMEEKETEETEEMMKSEKLTANGQSVLPNGTSDEITTEAEWETQTTAATRNAPPRPKEDLGGAFPDGDVAGGDGEGVGGEGETEKNEDNKSRRCRPRRPSNRLVVEAMLVTLFTILIAYFLMLGVFALVYYLFESDFLYGHAVTCPAMAADECSRGDRDVPCCDYSFDDPELERESRFIGVPGSGSSKAIAARVHLWLVRAHRSGEFYDVKRPKYLIYTHGNIDNLSFDKDLYRFLAKDLGFNVVAWDYPGFGKSTGKPSEDLIHLSMTAVFQWLVDEEKVQRKDIVLWGYSLGGQVTTKIANRYPGVMGVILQAPIDSSLMVVRATLPLSGWAYIAAITQPYNTGAEIQKLKSCLFIFVGAKDDTMEPYRMQSLFRRAHQTNPSCRKYSEIPSLDHLSDPLESPKFIRELRLYLNKIINMSN